MYLIQVYLKVKSIFIVYLKYIADECIQSAVSLCVRWLPGSKRMLINRMGMISWEHPPWLAHFTDRGFMWCHTHMLEHEIYVV